MCRNICFSSAFPRQSECCPAGNNHYYSLWRRILYRHTDSRMLSLCLQTWSYWVTLWCPNKTSLWWVQSSVFMPLCWTEPRWFQSHGDPSRSRAMSLQLRITWCYSLPLDVTWSHRINPLSPHEDILINHFLFSYHAQVLGPTPNTEEKLKIKDLEVVCHR